MIKKLSDAYAPSAKEEEVRKIISDDLSDFYTDISVDNLGNLIIHKPGNKKCIAITAPMDEISFVVTHQKDVENIIATSICAVKSNTLQNIIAIDENNNKFVLSKINKNTENIEKIGNISFFALNNCKGDKLNSNFISKLLIYDNNFTENDDYYIGKALERSVCCSVLCDIARSVANSMYEYYFIFSAQNYCDKKGAVTATHNLKIDELYNLCAIDVENEDIELNNGPVAVIRDKMLISNSDLIENNNLQRLISSNFVCEGGYYQRQHTTQKIISVGIPVNFLGCFNEVASKKDINDLKNLILEKVLP